MVIAIIAVLAAVIAPNAFRAIEKAKITRATTDMRSIKTAAMAFFGDTGTWPLKGIDDDTRSSGKGFVNDDDGYGNPVPNWDGPYLQKWAVNPWGNINSVHGNKYYWDASYTGDDNGDGIVGEAQVIMFNVPRKSGQTLDSLYDNGVLTGTDVGYIYENMVVDSPGDDPMTLNWMIKEPIE